MHLKGRGKGIYVGKNFPWDFYSKHWRHVHQSSTNTATGPIKGSQDILKANTQSSTLLTVSHADKLTKSSVGFEISALTRCHNSPNHVFTQYANTLDHLSLCPPLCRVLPCCCLLFLLVVLCGMFNLSCLIFQIWRREKVLSISFLSSLFQPCQKGIPKVIWRLSNWILNHLITQKTWGLLNSV